MKISYLAAILLLLSVFSVSLVHARVSIPISTPTSSNISFLSAFSSANSYIYAGFFAIVMFIIFAIALDRTQLSSGRIAISFIFALITFFLLYTDSALLRFFLNTFIVLAFIALILGMLAAVKSPRSIRLIGLIVALFLIIILFENDSGLTNFVNATFHTNILDILPLVFGIITVIIFIILLLRGVKTHSNIVLRVILLFIVFLLIALLIPGFAGFLFSPIVLISLFATIILALIIILLLRRRHYPKPSKQDKNSQKDAKVQQKALSSWAQKRALKKQQSNLNNKNNFISNSGNSQAGDLFDLANAANKGGLGPVPTDKAARKLFEKRASKEARNKDVSSLLNERNKLLDPNLNLSDSTRRKEVAKIDKKLKKISPKIVPQSPNQIRQKNLVNEQKNQLKQEMLEEQRLADAQLEAARKNAEKARAEQARLEEQAKLAEAARQQAEHDRLIKEQKEQLKQEMLEEQRLADAQLEAARKNAEREREQQRMLEEQAKLAEAARQQAESKNQQISQNITPGVVGPSSAFDKRIKTPLWFSHKSPVDKNGKLDVQMQNEIEARGLMDRRENLVNLINSGKLSGRQLKDARNELNRIDYRLKKYGRDIHR
ncbi:hypothetical protein M1558_03820 [Candidatus Parvarchaeota archaeon]|nr:hypothetical protein [Candidatus Parvarchaeota archaeon]